MRQYAWYSPELDAIILQSFMKGCEITFEWDSSDPMYAFLATRRFDYELTSYYLWVPLGEL